MKKLLEVLQYGDHDIRFNTDIDVKKNPHIVEKIIPALALTMATRLWGGNELSVLAMIRDGVKIQVFGPEITPPHNRS